MLSRAVNGNSQRRSDETQLRQELLAQQRRQFLYAQIPDVYEAEQRFGSAFTALVELLVRHDLAGLGTAAAGSPLYPELARTVL
ncbi:hypothetical protein [Hymenobacter elongatus]|uniref:Uncharacterized protein n=1 Tax=Hymenobacter elongatus TaxID=877208 RepID=A0A4Z0PKF1_9BACT|nr:hypothetical protein [Hymenobacter elongatus]TGE14520.1 hypothetical protein E5J99_15775 [Hymenobacter elongatus]